MAAYSHRAEEDALSASLGTSAPPLHNQLDLNVSISSEDDILSNEDLTLDKDEIGLYFEISYIFMNIHDKVT